MSLQDHLNDDIFLKKLIALQIKGRHNLKSVALKTYFDISLYFDNFEQAVNELKAGAVITEQEKLNYILKSLLQNFNHVRDLIDVLPERGRTIEYLKKNLSQEIQMKNRMKC